jgi:protoheme IX farnesyltransferase
MKAYISLTKPRILMGNVITAAAGFGLAVTGAWDVRLFLAMLLGLAMVMGSACVLNNFIDRNADEKMARTKDRALAKGEIPVKNAILFASFLGLAGAFVLAIYVNLLAAAAALFGFFVYVVVYSFSKYRTTHATLIGSVAGAIPPVVGYSAVSGGIDRVALLLFVMIALWQMPHFFAIAIYRLEDYAKASIPVLPLVKGIRTTKVQMLVYLIAFLGSSFLVTTHRIYLIAAALLGAAWLVLCLKGFTTKNDLRWARQMFLFSLITVTTLCCVLMFQSV